MFGLLTSLTALPNTHPAVVHGLGGPGDPGGVGLMVDDWSK